jgi:hypothetical protein
MLSRRVLRFLWPYGSMEMDSGGTMAMALWHYGTMALWHFGTTWGLLGGYLKVRVKRVKRLKV